MKAPVAPSAIPPVIYNVRSIRQMYNIIKANYDLRLADFKITEVSVAVFNDFKKDLRESAGSHLNFEFAYKYLEKCNKCYHITYRELNMYVISQTKDSPKMRKELFKNLYRVYLLSKIYDISKWGGYVFNFYIIMNPLKRCMPSKKNELIDVINVNGGYTYVNKNDIFIIRKEDYEKVILHELLHHNTLIHKQSWEPSNIRRLKGHFNIETGMLLIPNEAIIETYACVLNTVFHSIETGTSLKDNLKRDQEHSIILAKKILDSQGTAKWNEKTHSYCYIVFKTILYIYFNDFLKIYKYKNDTEITDFLIKYSQKLYRSVKRLQRLKRPANNKLKQTIY
jgi:hypothetical protein